MVKEKRVKAIDGDIVVSVVVTKEGNVYSSWCPELDIASCGDTPEEAVKNLREAIELYLECIEEEGIKEKVFRERGIKIVGHDEMVMPNSFVTQYRQKVKVPAR